MDILERNLQKGYTVDEVKQISQYLEKLEQGAIQNAAGEDQNTMDVDLQQRDMSLLLKKQYEKICQILSQKIVTNDKEEIMQREDVIYILVKLLIQYELFEELFRILESIHGFLDGIPNSRTAKIVTSIIRTFSDSKETLSVKSDFLQSMVDWCIQKKRVFLRHRIEYNHARVFFLLGKYHRGLEIIERLSAEVKKYDDKMLLIELMVLECKILYKLKNFSKAKTSLTAARANANAIYIPTELQSEIEMQAGILHAEDSDYKTAHSYFLEAYENYKSCGYEEETAKALKYVLLCRILSMATGNKDSGFRSFSQGAFEKAESMKAIAKAHENRSLKEFQEVLQKYDVELREDPVVMNHIEKLYERMLERNILMLIQPYSRVEISHLSKLIELPPEVIEKKLSTMILDKKVKGILDQGKNCLVIQEDVGKNDLYENSVSLISELDKVVKSLFVRANFTS